MRRPKLVVSKCLGFENCRYNGQGCSDKIIKNLHDHVDFCTVCPEVEIGLSIPREVIRIVDYDNTKKLIQHKTNIDHTDSMKNFSKQYVKNLDDVDGFILKSKSPSCGLKDVKVYHKNAQCSLYGGSNGFFTEEVINSYNHLPIENEGRLKNYDIRDEFFTKLFMINNFKDNKTKIKDFHEKNSLLLKMYDINKFYELDLLCTNNFNTPKETNEYQEKLYNTLQCNRNSKKNINILVDIYNKYEKNLSMKEKEIFVDSVVKYSKGKLHLSTLLTTIKIYAARFEDEYILSQTVFSPYPENLLDISDSGKGRNL